MDQQLQIKFRSKPRCELDLKRRCLRDGKPRALAHVHRSAGRSFQLEAMKQPSQRLVHRQRAKGNSGALPSARAKRHVLEAISLVVHACVVLKELLGLELQWVLPDGGVAVQLPKVDQ